MEFKIIKKVNEFLISGAGFSGLNLAAFVLEPAEARAQQVIAGSTPLQLAFTHQ
ncbi:MAG: DUF1778 domain-containing protein [Pseudomonadota bacterium]